MIQQLREAKQRHPGMIILFRADDCYEALDDDALLLVQLLGVRHQTRDGVALASFKHHALEAHLRRLLRAGHRVAVCDPVKA
jgi:DNA mismatch repair protein MutS